MENDFVEGKIVAKAFKKEVPEQTYYILRAGANWYLVRKDVNGNLVEVNRIDAIAEGLIFNNGVFKREVDMSIDYEIYQKWYKQQADKDGVPGPWGYDD